MPVAPCACIGMFYLSISVGGESPGQLGEGLGRTKKVGGGVRVEGVPGLRRGCFSELVVGCCLFCRWLRPYSQ